MGFVVSKTVGQEIAQWLKVKGISHIFGIPGGGASLDLINEASALDIPYVLGSHEGSSATTAMVFGDLEKTVGVCGSIMGPGALNMVFGAGLAMMERLPLMIFTDTYPDAVIDDMTHQKISHQELFLGTNKKTFTMLANRVFEILEEGYAAVFAGGRPGAVHIDLPNNLLGQESNSPAYTIDPEKVLLPENDIQKIIKKINQSKYPVMLIGSGAKDEILSPLLTQLVDRLRMPFLPSYRAKGMISEEHPMYAGVSFGISDEGSFEHSVISKSDLIIQVGTDRGEIPRVWGYTQDSVVIDSTDMGVDWPAKPSVKVLGNMAEILMRVVEAIDQRQTWEPQYIQELWNQIYSKVDQRSDSISTEGVITLTRELLPCDAYTSSETGVFNMMLGHLWKCYMPNTFLTPSGTTTMGFAIPAIIAAALHAPDKKGLAFCGDGSFHMRVGDLETLNRIKANVILVIFNDGALGTIQMSYHNKKYDCEGLELSSVNIQKIAEGYGFKSFSVNTHGEYKEALMDAIAHQGPSLIEVKIPSEKYSKFVKEIRQNINIPEALNR